MATWQHIESILDQIIDLEEPERTRYIEEHIDNDELKAEIRSLLLAELHAPAWIDSGVDRLLGTGGHIHEIADSVKEKHIEIDRYRIVKEIGRGGMSVVYLAERTDGEFDQQVAVKIIQPFGLDREDRFRRLRAERQILASLKHPNIARVFDGGMTPEGWPYMVMELVDGIPITTYCKEKNLDLNARLNLFQKVCDAAVYAHRNLVVHRDLKPGNILVTETGEVKLLDFGIAKLLEEDKDAEPLTQTGLPLMTPEYAAPEQFKGETVTTLVDVYSLGVILYELLAGGRPYDLSDKSISEMERLVCEEEPPKPSERIKRPDRFSKPVRSPLSLQLRGDLDIICLKILRKEPEERYKSVQELKEDLVRYHKGLPIQARPATFAYRAKKFILRNKGALATAILFLATIIGFGFYHVYQVTGQRNIAQSEAQKANRIKEFTTGLFYSNNPYSTLNIDGGITLKQVLEAGLRTIEAELADEPEIYAEMQYIMGHSLFAMGEYENARISLQKAYDISLERFGEHHPVVASVLSIMGRLEGMQGNHTQALSHLNEAKKVNTHLHGELSQKVAVNLAEIAFIHSKINDFEKSAEYYGQSLNIHKELGEEHGLDYNQTLSEYVNVQIRMGLLEEARENQIRAIERFKEIHGENHLNLANSYSRMAEIEYHSSNLQESEKFSKQSLDIQISLLSPNHPHLINTYNFLGQLYQRLGRFVESEKHLQHAIHLFNEHNRTDSLGYSTYLNNLALTKSSLGQLDSASVLQNQVIELRKQLLPANHPSITLAMYNLANLHYKMNNLELSRTLFEEVVERDKNSLGAEHPEVAIDLVKLAAVYRDMREYQLAEDAFLEAEVIFANHFPEHHYRIGEFYKEYGRLKVMQHMNGHATRLLELSLAIFMENYEDGHEQIETVQKYLSDISQME